VPHPGGFYNRRTQQVGVDGSYLDNLVLADRTLGKLRRAIEETSLAAKTTVIVSSDHSWRVDLWRPTTDWRAEDERVSGDRFDPRPLLMVHFPEQRSAVRMDRPFPLIEMHTMIQVMLAGLVDNAAKLESFAREE
jgi:hypothetical protein